MCAYCACACRGTDHASMCIADMRNMHNPFCQCTLCQVILVYTLQIATYVMLSGQPFALAAGFWLVWTRLFYTERVAKRFKDAKAAGVLRVRHRFRDAHEVEICARWVLCTFLFWCIWCVKHDPLLTF